MVIAATLDEQVSKEDGSDDKRNILFSANDIQQKMCIITVHHMLYISKYSKKTHLNVTVVYPSPAFGLVQCSCDSDTLTWICSLVNWCLWSCESPPEPSTSRDYREYWYTNYILNNINSHGKQVKCFIYKISCFNKNWLDTHYIQCNPISLDETPLAEWILWPAAWNQPELSWFNFSSCTSMAINELLNKWCTQTQCAWCTTTGRCSWWRCHTPPDTCAVMYH